MILSIGIKFYMGGIVAIASFLYLIVWACRDFALDHCEEFKPSYRNKWKDLFTNKTVFEETTLPYLAVNLVTTIFAFGFLQVPFVWLVYTGPLVTLFLYTYIQYRYIKRLWKFINAVAP